MILNRIMGSYYWRNILIWTLIVAPETCHHLYNHLTLSEIAGKAYINTTFYTYFIFHNRILYERLLRRKQYWRYFLTFFISYFIWRETAHYIWWLLSKSPGAHPYRIAELNHHDAGYWLVEYWIDVIYIYTSLAVYLSFRYFRENTRLLKIENAQKELELKRLNEQLSPHFLFNALNNIYNYVMESSNDAKELILKLSELMRYVLDSHKKEFVLLQDEVSFIEHYIAFEKERLSNRCRIKYSKDIQAAHLEVVPLTLFNIVENAFKHGTNTIYQTDISITIYADERLMRLTVVNDIVPEAPTSTRIGIENTRKRLDIIYGDRYKLTTEKRNNTFQSIMEINNTL